MSRHTLPSVLCLALIVVGAAGCDSDSGGASTPTLTPAEAQAAYLVHVDARVAAECARSQRCDSPPDDASTEACVAAFAAAPHLKRDRIAASIGASKTLFDPSAAAACEKVFAGACSLSFVTDIAPSCNAVITGNVPDGAACLGHFECKEPAGHRGLGPYCFAGCEGAWGDEETAVAGTCQMESPIGTAACP